MGGSSSGSSAAWGKGWKGGESSYAGKGADAWSGGKGKVGTTASTPAMASKGVKGASKGASKGKDKGVKGGKMEDDGRLFEGFIKSFNEGKGYGFIECADIKAEYGGDAFLHNAAFSGFAVGQAVTFGVYLNKDGKPQGINLELAGGAAKRARRA